MTFKPLILGGGAVVAEYYLPALEALGFIEGVTVADLNPERIRLLREQFSFVHGQVSDYRAALQSCLADQPVLIALPNSLHFEASQYALELGHPVLCDKPLSMKSEQCEKLGTYARENRKVLRVGMVRRFLPCFRALRECLQNPLFGKVTKVNFEIGDHYAWLSDSGAYFRVENGGILTDIGVHCLDQIQVLLGDLRPIAYTDDARGGVEANCEYHLEDFRGTPIVLKLSRTHRLSNRAEFATTEGKLFYDWNEPAHAFFISKSNKLFSKIYPLNLGHKIAKDLETCFVEQFETYDQLIRTDHGDMADAFCAAKTARLIEWAYAKRNEQAAGLACDAHLKQRSLDIQGPSVVTGGTGFIGQALIERLWQVGVSDIRVPLRNYRTCAGIARYSLNMKPVSLFSRTELRNFFEGSRYVFHLAYGRDGDQAKTTIEGTENVVEAAIEAGVECVVILSTMYVFGTSPVDETLDETASYRPMGGVYGRSKAAMEKWCLKRAKQSKKIRIVVLNPSCVFGPGGKTYTTLPVELAAEGRFCYIDEGRGVCNYVYIDNLIDAMCAAAVTPAAHGQRFIINDGACTWREFLDPLLANLKKQIPNYSTADFSKFNVNHESVSSVINALLHDTGFISKANKLPGIALFKKIIGRMAPGSIAKLKHSRLRQGKKLVWDKPVERVNYPVWLSDLFGIGRTRFSSQKAQNVMGWRPSIIIGEAQQKTVQWLADSGYYRPKEIL